MEKENMDDSCSAGSCGSLCGCEGKGDDAGCCAESSDLKVDFLNYIMSMVYQTMIFLGDVPNPTTGKIESNFRQAKFLIETLNLLKEKTKGNLSNEEDAFFTSSLQEIQIKFSELSLKDK